MKKSLQFILLLSVTLITFSSAKLQAATITVSGGPLSALTTTYGTASSSISFNVSGTSMSAGVLVTPPAGYEVSKDNITFSPTVTVGASGSFGPITVYIRLAATTAVGSYAGNVTMSSSPAASKTIATISSTVSKAALSITANNVSKAYGTALSGGSGSVAFTSSGLKNSESIGSVTITYGTGSAATAAVSSNPGAVTATAATGGTFSASNYTITYYTGNITVTAAALTITATNVSKVYGTTLTGGSGSTAFTSSGLQNGETIGSITIVYGTGSAASAPVGTNTGTITASAATGGTFTASNYTISYSTGNITVTAVALTISGLTANSKVYDRTTAATLTGTPTLNGVIGSDVVNLGGSPTSTFSTANAGAGISVTVSGYTISGAQAGNYTLTQPSGLTADITAKTLTVTLAVASNKTYNGNTNATITGGVLFGVILGDVVSVSTTGTFASASVGTGISVTVALAGANAGNYTLTQPGITANITVASLTITATGPAKPYGTVLSAGASATNFTTTGLIAGESVTSVTLTPNAAGLSATTAAGAAYSITPSGATGTGGFSTSNYNITYTVFNSTVSKAALAITANGVSKVYGTTITGGSGSFAFTSSGLQNGETIGSVTIAYGTGSASTAAVGTYANITASAATGGTFTASNYTITYVVGNITVTAKTLTITSPLAANKVYDGTTTATITGTLSGIVGADLVTLVGTGTFANADAANGVAVNASCTLSGAAAGNYILTQPTGLTANITPKALTITGVSVSNKAYDGTTDADLAGTAALSGVISGDVVTLGGSPTGIFASKNVATGISVTLSGYTISGTDAGNYTITQPTGLTANITTASLTIAATGPSKVQGTALTTGSSTTNFIYYGTVNGETITSVTLTPNAAGLSTATTAGTAYTVTPSAAVGASGYIASNYTINYVAFSGICSRYTYTWKGTSSTSWSTSGNWTSSPSGGTYPGTLSSDDVVIPSGTTFAPTLTTGTTINNLTFSGNNTLTISSAQNLKMNTGFTINSGVTAANLTFSGASNSTKLELVSAILTNNGAFNVSGTGILQVDNGGSYIYNSGTFTANGNATLYLTNGSAATNAITNAGTFYAGTANSTCYIEMDDYGSINNAGTFYLGPTSLMYYFNDSANHVIINNQNGATFTLQSNANGSAAIGEIPQGKSNTFTGTFNVERYFQGGSTYSAGRYIERSYRIISSCVNNGVTVNGNAVFGLNYIVGSTAGQTTAANSTTNAFITGCTGGSTSAGNPSVYLFNESLTPSNTTFTSGNFLGITNITNSTTGGTITASDGGTYSLPVGTGVLFYFRGAATNWSTRTTSPYIAPENVTLTSTGNLNVGSYTFKNWYTPSSSTIAYTGTGTGTNYNVRGFSMIGNPYPCPIDWLTGYSGATGIVRTNVAPTVWEFNPVTCQYDTYLATSATTGTGTGSASRYIASGQGFYVQATAANPSLTIDEYAKVVLNASNGVGTGALPSGSQLTGSNLFMSTSPVQEVTVDQSLRLKLSLDSINHDDIVIGFNPNASANFSVEEDAKYLSGINAPEGLSSISADNVLLAINYLPFPKQSQLVIKLNVEAKNSGEYDIQRTALNAIPQLYEVWLMDKYKNDSLDIRHNNIYRFSINKTDTASFGKNRFTLVFRQNKALGIHLLNFTAVKATSGAQIAWATENEQNYTHFTVERSTDGGTTFNIVGGFGSNSGGTYSLLDKSPLVTGDMYRLKIEDLNGTITYSKVITLTYTSGKGLTKNNITIYPNPAKSTINLTITPPYFLDRSINRASGSFINSTPTNSNTVFDIKIMNSSGVIVKTATSTQKEWQTDISSLSPGTYMIQVVNKSDNSLMGDGSFVKL